MARTLKSKGLEELRSLNRRIDRQYKLGRIGKKDWTNLISHGKAMEAIIVNMTEINEHGEEEGGSEW